MLIEMTETLIIEKTTININISIGDNSMIKFRIINILVYVIGY